MNVFRDIEHYSKERKISLINAIEKINWDTNYNPDEFLQLLISNSMRKWALSRMVSNMPYITIRRLVTKEFLIEYVNEEIISMVFPITKQKSIRLLYSKLQSWFI